MEKDITAPAISTSKRYALNKVDLMKAIRFLAVALAGTFLTTMTEVIGQFDFGDWTPMIASGVAMLVEVGRRFLTNYSVNNV